ncbi:MAG: biotin/lipoyl-binding protein, partial [Planctomycetes bacterium]|nr:biotin/lipoyl-binding protein [Planctomycetota bacterium]
MKKVVAIVIVLLLAGTAAAYGYRHWFAPERDTPAGRLRVYGNIEQRDAALAFPQPERIATVLVEEGDQVEAGQLLATQRTEQLGIRIATAEARVRAQQALVDELGHGARPEEIARARALHAAAEVRATNAERVLERVRATAESGASSAQELDDTEAAVEVARADAEATRQALQLVLAGAREEERRRAAAELDALQAQVALLRQ